ncbi:LysR family transcriptional regulator [Kitasatospora sp. NPDC058201]|uniref:LysR family transcriptional regulator n=1 Tax=Streptomycetaceae TaxID=2062 RepID=UPI002E79870E|nr:LysR family transcriptional regulator [Streptomyces sp. BE303]MED7947733.1 LysR family transcriptional regulator [Streptomyces sp. BE303]
MGSPDLRELECFLAVSEELHFGRAGERLLVSQSRVSQLVRSLERRIGTRLLDRTSRRVRLTPAGKDFLAELAPAYAALRGAVDRATRASAQGVRGLLRVGFQGSAGAGFTAAVTAFRRERPDCAVEITELPLADPFGAVRRGDVDTAVVLLPVVEEGLTLGLVFSRQPHYLAVAHHHPWSGAASVDAEQLAGTTLIDLARTAPAYWRRAQVPDRTPDGVPIPTGPEVRTLQEGLSLAAGGQGAMLLCRPTADHHRREDLCYLPVTGLPDSALGLVWRAGDESAAVRGFAGALAAAVRAAPGPARA